MMATDTAVRDENGHATLLPTRKIVLGGIGGAGILTQILIAISTRAFGYEMSVEEAAAIAAAIGVIASWWIPNGAIR